MSEYHDCGLCHMKPGSESARLEGCICPVMDNGRGHTDPRFMVVMAGCPVHSPEDPNATTKEN